MKNVVLSALLMGTLMAGTAAYADYQPVSRFPIEVPYNKNKKDVPLMVIRFNEPEVAFQDPLYETMNKAFKIKPGATFDIVSVSQKSPNKDAQKRNDQLAQENTGRVMDTFNEMGMPVSRLTMSTTTENLPASEVRIFVH